MNAVKKAFNLVPFGQKGWLYNINIPCPYCQKKGKFGFFILGNNGIVHCFKCDYKTSLYTYLLNINQLNLLGYEKSVQNTNKLKKISDFEKNYIKESKKIVNLPYGFQKITSDQYLNNRGFNHYHYKMFTPGYTDSIIESHLKNYVIFILHQHDQIVGWLARSKFSKEWHEQNLLEFKQGKANLKLRYINASVDFSSIIGGYDEINDKTKIVIIVEGLFDKINVDNQLKLNTSDTVKCVFTFGNKISNEQLKLLKEKKVKHIILMYDYNTINQSKKFGLQLDKYFKTEVCTITTENLDPGDATRKQLLNIIQDRKSAHDYFVSMIGNKLK